MKVVPQMIFANGGQDTLSTLNNNILVHRGPNKEELEEPHQ